MSPTPEKPLPARSPTTSNCNVGEFSREERSTLLALAHKSIEAALENREIPLDAPTPHFEEPRGVFTTLYRRGQLRGCVGYVLPVTSVYRTVAETARAAAFEDTRFHPVTPEEAPELEVHLSVLSPLRPIAPAQVEVGRHGLLVSMGARRGLLLPQVPVEYGWDRNTFLEQTCRKAGLPLDSWQHGATLEAFTAEVFGDNET
ncbi:MAG TPA: AmmeMemoRadiSam system protein A [Terriglobales bacterium]|nr:AmmeMemoRadiSam system protein A [Terriglobales bacterium]